MEILKRTVRGSPFVGIFCSVTEEIGLFPRGVENKELRGIEEMLGIEVIKASIASSNLLGVFSAGIGKKFILPEMAEDKELDYLKSRGLKVRKVEGSALGNLVAINGKAAIVSTLLKEEAVKEIKDFFGINVVRMNVAETELPGASMKVTDRGFVVNPNTNDDEIGRLGKLLGVGGIATTANYGDPFVGNDIVANSKGAIVGLFTTTHEIIRINDGLGGE